ncbi:hypothetical protein [Aquamicrobium defluvii]|uniref:Uncharacterized protein n=1 Tax=Aquamicrobium defluvii TaxID=69279 RepID=A0A011UVW3_9HYPH|nr:hypothetical protein [Aquamicrobium defluvii]EXL09983.1 hypothetical protein BG36_17600 [Aquamicrobium defluvii]EZQ16779.1 hypothetical protein CF98_39865 [Halopseudomonas bauzanensis]
MRKALNGILAEAITIARAERERRWAAGKVGQLPYGTKPYREWAEKVAPRISDDDFEDIVFAVDEAVPDFPGDVIRFFERCFEGLQLKGGALVAA